MGDELKHLVVSYLSAKGYTAAAQEVENGTHVGHGPPTTTRHEPPPCLAAYPPRPTAPTPRRLAGGGASEMSGDATQLEMILKSARKTGGGPAPFPVLGLRVVMVQNTTIW